MSDPTLPKIIVYGGGGHGKAVIDLLRALGGYDLVGVVDDALPLGARIMGSPLLGGAAQLPALAASGIQLAANAVGGIGNVAVRLKVFDLLQAAGFHFPCLAHPRAVIEPGAVLEDGVQVLALSYIGSDARVGFGSVINAGVVVSHDCRLGKVVNLSPGAMLAGDVVVEEYAQIGMAATINIGVRIGAGARVGNGATVKADVPAGRRVYAGAVWPQPQTQPTARLEKGQIE